MRPADHLSTDQLVKRRVSFKEGQDHAGCWHQKIGLKTGLVLRVVPSLAQKAELLATEGIVPPEGVTPDIEVPRLWVKADPCSSFPRGCEVAVEKKCLLLI